LKVSLIVCTRNRGGRLANFLAAVASLDSVPGGWELILVDNASTDCTPHILHEFTQSVNFPVRTVQSTVAGLARSRNVGLAASAGEILAFTDDDCYPRPDYLRALVDVFKQHRSAYVGGRVVLHDHTDATIGVRDATTPVDIPPRTFLPAGIIHGANMAVVRELVEDIGGFDPHLGAGTPCVAGEDIEYLARAAWAGWAGRYDPRPVVAHHHGRKPGPAAEAQARGYDYGRGAYLLKLSLSAPSRSTYLRQWRRRTLNQIYKRRFGCPWREFVGALTYMTQHFLRAEAIPRFFR
jgi:glycosyltransferase involved in cell wall biosynthesis